MRVCVGGGCSVSGAAGTSASVALSGGSLSTLASRVEAPACVCLWGGYSVSGAAGISTSVAVRHSALSV